MVEIYFYFLLSIISVIGAITIKQKKYYKLTIENILEISGLIGVIGALIGLLFHIIIFSNGLNSFDYKDTLGLVNYFVEGCLDIFFLIVGFVFSGILSGITAFFTLWFNRFIDFIVDLFK